MRIITPVLLCVCCCLVAQKNVNAQSQTAGIAARLDGEAITVGDLDASARTRDSLRLFQLREQEYDLQWDQLEALLNERLLKREASRLGVTVSALLEQHAPTQPVSEMDVRAEVTTLRLKGIDVPSDQKAEPLVRRYLADSRARAARDQYLEQLRRDARASGRLAILIQPLRQNVPVPTKEPTKGAGPVTLVVFGDFECPYCRDLAVTIKQLSGEFPNQLRLVWKDFPLPNHKFAMAAAIAGVCAHRQSKFWEFHDAAFTSRDRLDEVAIPNMARSIGLEGSSFDACIRDSGVADEVREASRLASSYQLKTTPTVSINGRTVVGNAPIFVYRKMIQQELNVQH